MKSFKYLGLILSILISGNIFAQVDILSVDYGPPPEADTWHKFTIPLTAETFNVEPADFLASMQSISMIRIRTEMHDGSDECGVDSIAFGNGLLSTFDSGTDGWSALGDGTMSWEPTGGVGNGYITIEDWASGDWHYATAPSSWSGDLSAYIGQNFTFYYKTNYPDYHATVELHTGDTKRIILDATPQSIAPGGSAQLDVSLSETPVENVTVSLSSSNSALVSTPPSVIIPAGSSSASVTINAGQNFTAGDEVVITATASGYLTTRVTLNGQTEQEVTTLIVDNPAYETTLNEGDEDWYQFQVTQAGTYIIETHSDIDTYMRLLESDGTTQITNDDDSGDNSNAKITYNLAIGWYKVEVSGYYNTTAGDYSIDVKLENLAPEIITLVVDAAAYQTSLAEGAEDWYQFQVTQAGTYTIEVHSELDTYMRLLESDGTTQITYDDDSGVGSNALITQNLTEGWYKVEVTGYYTSTTGDYSIDVKLENLAPEIITLLVDAAAYETTLAEGAKDWYQFQVTQAGTYTIETHSNLDTYMRLLESDGTTQIIYNDDDGEGNNAKITYTLAIGWYRVEVSGYYTSTAGDYSIDVVSQGAVEIPDILSVNYGPPTTADTWQKFTIPITAATFGLEEAVFNASMKNISLIRIATEMSNGVDKCGLDQISLGNGFLSSFDSGTEDWSAMGDGTMSWEATGGVPGGHLTIQDWSTGILHWAAAPVSWTGDLSAYIGQDFTFYYKTNQPNYEARVEFHTGTANRVILSADKQTLSAGEATQMTVSLSPVPSENVTVNLSSSNSGKVTVPSSVTIPGGSGSATVTISATQDINEGDIVVITASASGYETTRVTIAGGEEAASIVTLVVDGAAESATLPAGGSHWYQFEVTTNGEHIIETHGSTDMYMILYESNGTTQISYNDDGGEGNNSKITWYLTNGWYKVEISGYSSSVTGDYSIDVKAQSNLLPPANLTANIDPADANDILLSWEAPSSGTPTGYNVYQSFSENGTYTLLGSVASVGARIYDNTDGIHWFYVTAQYIGGESEPSNKATATIGGEPIEIPDILSVNYGPPTTADTWQKFTIPITAATFGLEEAVFNASMKNISLIRIATEMSNGVDKCGLDQISLGNGFLSSFDSGTEDWSAMGDGTMSWEATGGVPGGHLTIQDWSTGILHWAAAPVSWTGDLSAYIGQDFTFYYKTNQPNYEARVEFHTGTANRVILSADKQTLSAGEATQMTVSLSPVPSENVTVNLSSSNSGKVTVPSSVTIPGGSGSATVTISATQDINEGDIVVITASASGYETTRVTIAGGEEAASIVTLVVDGAAESATLPAGGSHWYQFEVTTNGEHIIETHGSTDMYMILYESNGTTQISYNDDGGEGNNSKITWYLTNGWYKVEISGYSSSVTGDYSIDVKTSKAIEIPDILSVDYGPPAEADTWVKYTIPLTAETFDVEPAVFHASMQNITMIRIRTEMRDGSDKCGVDSIALGNGFLSTFDTGTDGWSAMGDGTMSWENSGGVTGAYITIEDWTSGDWHYATAPAVWSGDLSAYIGQNFTFYYKTNYPSYHAVVEFHTGDAKRIILSASPQTIAPGGSTQLIVYLSEPSTEDVTVSLSSSNSSRLTVPSSVTILAGYSSATVTVEATQNMGHDDEVVITGSASGYQTTRITFIGSDPTSISELNSNNNFNLYPNPSNGKFILNFNQSVINAAMINVSDILGRSIYSSLENINQLIEIDLGNVPAGIYNVQVIVDNNKYNRKLIIK